MYERGFIIIVTDFPDNTKMPAKDVLEILMLLPSNEKKMIASPTDSVKTRMAFLKFLQVTFHSCKFIVDYTVFV